MNDKCTFIVYWIIEFLVRYWCRFFAFAIRVRLKMALATQSFMTIGTLHFKFAHSSQKCSHQGPSCLCVHLIASVEHEAFQIERYGSQIVRRVADVGTLAVKRGHQAQMGHIRGGRGGGGGKVGDDKTRVSLKKIRYGLGFFFSSWSGGKRLDQL